MPPTTYPPPPLPPSPTTQFSFSAAVSAAETWATTASDISVPQLALYILIGLIVLLCLCICCCCCIRRLCCTRASFFSSYSGLHTNNNDSSRPIPVVFELSNGLREDGDLGMGNVKSVKQLRLLLLQLADELLLDPEDDLGEWTLRYTDRGGKLLPVGPMLSIEKLRTHATELRVTAGRALRR